MSYFMCMKSECSANETVRTQRFACVTFDKYHFLSELARINIPNLLAELNIISVF